MQAPAVLSKQVQALPQQVQQAQALLQQVQALPQSQNYRMYAQLNLQVTLLKGLNVEAVLFKYLCASSAYISV